MLAFNGTFASAFPHVFVLFFLVVIRVWEVKIQDAILSMMLTRKKTGLTSQASQTFSRDKMKICETKHKEYGICALWRTTIISMIASKKYHGCTYMLDYTCIVRDRGVCIYCGLHTFIYIYQAVLNLDSVWIIYAISL